MYDRIGMAVTEAKRSQKKFAIMFIDLDNFKPINDTLGHHVGDQLLQEVSRRFLTCIREQDTIARIGGDEFVVIYKDIDTFSVIQSLINRFTKTIDQGFTIEGHSIAVGLSIGISLYPDHGSEVITLLKYADVAMYKAKQENGNHFVLYTPSLARGQLEDESLNCQKSNSPSPNL